MTFFRSIAPVLPVVALLALFVSTSAVPLSLSDRDERTSGAVRPAGSSDRLRDMQTFLSSLDATMTNLNATRCDLLRQAAVDGDDLEGLRVASQSYRDAIVRLRGEIMQLDRELNPQEVERLVGTMMAHTTSASKLVLTAELLGHMESE